MVQVGSDMEKVLATEEEAQMPSTGEHLELTLR